MKSLIEVAARARLGSSETVTINGGTHLSVDIRRNTGDLALSTALHVMPDPYDLGSGLTPEIYKFIPDEGIIAKRIVFNGELVSIRPPVVDRARIMGRILIGRKK